MDLSRRTVDPKTNPDSPYWKSQRLSVKIIEAKHLAWLRKGAEDHSKLQLSWEKNKVLIFWLWFGIGERTCDPYVVCRIDNRTSEEQRTSTVWNSEAPFWVSFLVCLHFFVTTDGCVIFGISLRSSHLRILNLFGN